MDAEKGCDLVNAILALNPDAEITQRGPLWTDVEFHDGNPSNLTEKQVLEKQQELLADYDAKKYQRDRATSYPSIQEQLDMQYWDAVNGTKKWQEAVAKVKADNPKPE